MRFLGRTLLWETRPMELRQGRYQNTKAGGSANPGSAGAAASKISTALARPPDARQSTALRAGASPPAFRELAEERLRHHFDCAVDQNHVIRRVCRPPVRQSAGFDLGIGGADRDQIVAGMAREGRILFESGHVVCELCQKRARI